MRIAEHVEMLAIRDEQSVIYPTLLWDDRDLVLIDTAFPGQLEKLRTAIEKAGFSLEKITKVILTHQDLDHIGCAKALSELGAEILAHEREAPYLQWDETPVKIAALEKHLSELSEEDLAFYHHVKASVPQLTVTVNHLLQDGEVLDCCGGIRVIHTPGHTPGHAAFLLEQSRILITGDAANITDGVLTGANPVYTQDMAEAGESFQKMMRSKPYGVVSYHGGFLTVGQ